MKNQLGEWQPVKHIITFQRCHDGEPVKKRIYFSKPKSELSASESGMLYLLADAKYFIRHAIFQRKMEAAIQAAPNKYWIVKIENADMELKASFSCAEIIRSPLTDEEKRMVEAEVRKENPATSAPPTAIVPDTGAGAQRPKATTSAAKIAAAVEKKLAPAFKKIDRKLPAVQKQNRIHKNRVKTFQKVGHANKGKRKVPSNKIRQTFKEISSSPEWAGKRTAQIAETARRLRIGTRTVYRRLSDR